MQPEIKTFGNKKTIFLVGLGVLLIIGFWFTNKKEQSLLDNQKFTIGKVTDVYSSYQSHRIDFKYYVKGKLYEASNPLDATYPKFHRTSRPIINKYYNVEYDSINPKNSKIIIGKKSYYDYEIPDINGIKIKGLVEKISTISENYLDLYIKYKIYDKDFSFRCRFHKDSLPCKDYENCLNSKVDLKVAKLYPELNDLYFQSYDRTAMRKRKLRNN